MDATDDDESTESILRSTLDSVDRVVDQITPDEVQARLTNLLRGDEAQHKPWCRTHLRVLFPNYGATCTCDVERH